MQTGMHEGDDLLHISAFNEEEHTIQLPVMAAAETSKSQIGHGLSVVGGADRTVMALRTSLLAPLKAHSTSSRVLGMACSQKPRWTNNPFQGIDVGDHRSTPAALDWDGDGFNGLVVGITESTLDFCKGSRDGTGAEPTIYMVNTFK